MMDNESKDVEDSPLIYSVKNLTPIQEFYKDATIFITGGTGFLGKVLLEKLLRSCSDLTAVYLLIREKRGKSIEQRLTELLDDAVFVEVKKYPKLLDKIHAVAGDCTIAGLGLSPKDVTTLVNDVNIVFHVAATVKFDEKLRLAIAINISGTRDVLDLCRQMHKIKSIIHVSTAYANCHIKKIDEQFYDYPVNYRDLSDMIDKLDDRAVDQITPRLLGRWPNTYSMTKALAEQLVIERHGGLPIGVFRPAIVVSTYREPIKGWTDNYYGPTGIAAAVMLGALGSLHCRHEINANVVPADMCVNALITSAWDVALNWKQSSQPPVYNYVSTVDKPITWNEYNKINMLYGHKYPVVKALWAVQFDMVRSGLTHEARMLLFHLLPAALVDTIAIAFLGRRTNLLEMHFKVRRFSRVLSHFATNDWHFSNDNVRGLYKRLDERDKKMFDFDMSRVDWLDFFKYYILGIRKHLFKEDESTLPAARRRQAKLSLSANILKMILCYVAVYLTWCSLSGLCRTAFSLLVP